MCSLFFIAWPSGQNAQSPGIRCVPPDRIKREAAGAVILTGFFLLAGGGCLVFDRRPFRSGQPVCAGFEGYCREAGGLWTTACAMLEQRLGLEEGQISQAADRQITLAAEHIEGKLAPDLLNHSFQYLTKLAQWAGFLFIIFIGAILLMRDYEGIREKLETYRLYGRVKRILSRICSTAAPT